MLMNANNILVRPGRFGVFALAAGILGLALSAVGILTNSDRFYLSWLAAFAYWTTLALGGLFFTMLHHVTGAVWSVVVRRSAEAMSMALPLLLVFFIPVIAGAHSLFHWTHADAVASDPVLQGKAPYLNTVFFTARGIVYFLVWAVLAWALNKHSLAQDANGDPRRSRSLRKVSAAGMFLFAFTVTFAAFDWLMSLDPHWYSTIYGVYVFTGGFLAFIAFMTALYLVLKKRGELADAVTTEHYHDLGRMLFAFTVFWAYIGGSQYFLIWYANIPEETIWYLNRWDAPSWRAVSLLLIALHFVVPFLALIFRVAKRNFAVLRATAILLLVMHYVDIYWLVMPNHHAAGGVQFCWTDIAAFLAVGGFVMWLFWSRFSGRPALPTGDPKLDDSKAYRV